MTSHSVGHGREAIGFIVGGGYEGRPGWVW